MNRLEKFFVTLTSSQSKALKGYATEELTSQIREYVDFTPYILKQTYKLLCGHASEDRRNGARILRSLMFQFKLVTDFKIEYGRTSRIYLGSTGEQFDAQAPSVQEQKRVVKRMAKLEHIEANFLSDIDFKAGNGESIKRQKIEEKQIENVLDFFEQINDNLLSYEWQKRHGAFLAFVAMFSEESNGDTQVRVDPKLFLKIYEILVTDKFNDFVDDRTVAPVRDAAACLLSSIYPLVGPNDIVEKLIGFLDHDDWQVQFSGLIALGYLKDFVFDVEGLCTKLVSLLSSPDEDVKLLSAELLCHFPTVGDPNVILDKCWKNLEAEEVISVSKTSILSLLTKVYKENPMLTIPSTKLKELFPCFNSPVPEVRTSILNIAESFSDESIDFLIAEVVLIEEKEDIRRIAMNILRKRRNLPSNLVIHFMSTIGGSLYEPYKEDDFVSYDDLYFTKSGIKVIGKDEILKNRCLLFGCIMRTSCSDIRTVKTMISKTFHSLYESIQNLSSGIETETRSRDVDELERYFEECHDLKMAPLKEFKKKIMNPEINSVHPMVDPLYVDYIRMITSIRFPDVTDAKILYGVESCVSFLNLFSRIIVEYYDSNRIDIDEFLSSAYEGLIDGKNGFLSFFEAFDTRFLIHPFFGKVLEMENRLDFFSKTIHIYVRDEYVERLQPLFDDAFEKRNSDVVAGMVRLLEFNERFVRRMLDELDVELLDAVLTNGDCSFNPLFVKPLLKNISNDLNRKESSKIFSRIIPTLGFRTNPKISDDLLLRIEEEKTSLESLLDVKKIPDYVIRCPMDVKLRDYQVEGVKWLSFLHSFNLNGILADDMGLGKTLQVLTFLCSEMYETTRKILVICPSSLTGHWKAEIKKFFGFITAETYRKEWKGEVDVLITSYESFRNDYMNFIEVDWFYVVVDEGHILRNKQTLLYSRMNMITCPRKILLTGTPVHNSVEDLVSLFHILMPNYLGSEKDCGVMNVKMSDSEIERTREKLNILHKKVLPFILRRLKIDVLKDLPPKIIRDISVEFGSVQEELYREIDERGESNMDSGELEYGKIDQKNVGFKRSRALLLAASHIGHFKESSETSCKIKALEDIITLCGGEDLRNKILVFFQFKSTIDLVIADIVTKYKIKYSRIDGSVPSASRNKIAEDFNGGTTQMLFLTTQVGGLGLNLTGADIVVMYEHDWNPFNDLQAMDRAHRIGQKRTVNVFRLISKGTLEEKVMNLQSFKLFVANSLVSQQNADIETMDTKDLLERFQSS